MADTKISALPSGAPAQAGDEYVIARSGANYKLTGTNLLGLVTSTANTFTADQTFGVANATTLDATNVEVTNLKAKDGTAAATVANSTGVIAVSTKVEYADGTAAAPTVTNTGDTDTGVYFPAANEVAVTTGGTVAAGFNSNGLFFRNRIINGDMRIDQRNAGAAFTSSGNLYCIDRWLLQAVGATNTAQQTNGTGNNKAVIITGNTSNTLTGFSQRIESWNISDLAGQIVTVSFTLSGSASGSVSVRRIYPTATDNYSSTTEPSAGISVNFTTSPTRYSVTFTLASDANKGLWLYFDFGGVGAGVTRTIENVQLESGSVATPFERRPYGTELMLCQRYYEKSYDQGTAPGTATSTNTVYSHSCSAAIRSANNVPFLVLKRSAATPRTWDQAGNSLRTSRYDATTGLLVANNANNIAVLSGLTTGFIISIAQAANEFSAFQWDASAEL